MLHVSAYNNVGDDVLNDKNVMYFTNDDDFASFCIDPTVKTYTITNDDGTTQYLSYYDFTKQYLDAVANGIKFCVKDLCSHVNKDGYLGYSNCTKKIDNIEKYYGED